MQTSPTTRHIANLSIGSRSDGARVLVMAASTRTGSINRALARQIAERFVAAGDDAETVELGEHPLPLYSDAVERCGGVPEAARELVGQIADAEVLVIVSPEYNGTFTPLLKNTIDWATRVSVSAFAHLTVLLASASPGKGGGANGLAMVRTWMSNMGVRVADDAMSVGSARLGDDGNVTGVDDHELTRFVQQAVRQRTAA
jgi:NAD(P)H-dependent FMN reductase